MRFIAAAFTTAMLVLFRPVVASASEPIRIVLTLKDHRFIPAIVSAPAGRKLRIELTNLDAASEEFDSGDLKVEEDVTPRGHVSFTIGPLAPGSYSFMGEAHPTTALGRIAVTPTK